MTDGAGSWPRGTQVESNLDYKMQQELMQYLTPMLGQETAANLIKHYCARMKISIDDLKPAHLRDLATSMRPMLAVWLGSTGAARVSDEIAQMGSKAVVG